MQVVKFDQKGDENSSARFSKTPFDDRCHSHSGDKEWKKIIWRISPREGNLIEIRRVR
jgi:hypothetical protein